jgi:hypothetical protein
LLVATICYKYVGISSWQESDIPEACLETPSPVLLVTHQPPMKIILDSAKRHKCLFHSSYWQCLWQSDCDQVKWVWHWKDKQSKIYIKWNEYGKMKKELKCHLNSHKSWWCKITQMRKIQNQKRRVALHTWLQGEVVIGL